MRRGNPVIWLAVALHLAQAFGLLLDPGASAATSLAPVVGMTGVRGALLVLIMVAIAAAVVPFFQTATQRFALIFPQQALLCLAAGAAIVAMWSAAYADLEPRSRAHIFVDQIVHPIMAIAHGIAMLRASRMS
jgi:uncharacterized membrane-anchored protein